jgi:hypothetical protein
VQYDSLHPHLSSSSPYSLRWIRALLLIGAICSALLSACAFITPGDLAALQEDKHRLDAMTKQQQTEIAALQAKLRAGETQLKELKNRQTLQRRKLHATTQQAVRAETMLHGLACAPCAASRIAEVETALSTQTSSAKPARSNRSVNQARRLLQVSNQEYEHGNYARSIELADEAYQLVDRSQSGVIRKRRER